MVPRPGMVWPCQLVNLTPYPSLLRFTACQPHSPTLILIHSCHPSGLGSSDMLLCVVVFLRGGGVIFRKLSLGHLTPCLFPPGNSLTPNWSSCTGCAWSRPPSASCLSSWSMAACRITCAASGGSWLQRPCWACAWTCARAWPTWKRRVSSTGTW